MSGGLLPTANFLYPDEPEKACFLIAEFSLQGIVFEDPENTPPRRELLKSLFEFI